MPEVLPKSNANNLQLIDRYEIKNGPTSGIITYIRRDLELLLGKDSTLPGEIERFTGPFRPMTRLTYGDEPPLGLKKQGRGFYLEPGIYVKGVGNDKLKGGYPSEETEEIMYESVSDQRSEPRPLGALFRRKALNEYGTALAILACKAEELASVDALIEANVTIPIGVADSPQLTQLIQKVIRQRIKRLSGDDPNEAREKEFLSRQKNLTPLGTIALRVPGDERIGLVPDTMEYGRDITEEEKASIKRVADPEISARLGAGMRDLLDMGFVFTWISAHGQNFYTEGAPADLGDLVALGDVKNPKLREMLIYNHLARNGGLAPCAFPSKEFGITAEDVYTAQAKFWEKLLDGIASPEAIRRIPHLIPTMREQILLAVARLFVEKTETDRAENKQEINRWEVVAGKRRKVLQKYRSYGTIVLLDETLKGEFSKGAVRQFEDRIRSNEPSGIDAMVQFLKKGDERFLDDPKLALLRDTADAIATIPVDEERNAIFELMGKMQVRRFARSIFGRYSQATDPIIPEHMEFIRKFTQVGRFKTVRFMLTCLDRVVRMWPIDEDVLPDKPSKHYFANGLLMDEDTVRRIYEEIFEESSRRHKIWRDQTF